MSVRVPLLIALAVVVLAAGTAFTAANTVASSRIGAGGSGITANDLKPPACAALNLTRIRVGTGGGGGSALVLGSPGIDNLSGGGGNDCILGGGGTDIIRGNGGTDVCIGGPGLDVFLSGCETIIQ